MWLIEVYLIGFGITLGAWILMKLDDMGKPKYELWEMPDRGTDTAEKHS